MRDIVENTMTTASRMRLPIALAALITVTPAMADDTATDLAKAWWKANDLCRVSSDPAVSQPSCEARAQLDQKLAESHWCFGQLRDFPAERAWHFCGGQSSALTRQALSKPADARMAALSFAVLQALREASAPAGSSLRR